MLRVEEWLEGSDLSRIADRLKTQDVNDVTIRQQFLQLVIENQRDPAAFIRIIVDLATMHQRFSAALPLALLEDWIDVMRVDQFHLAFNVLKDTTSIILTVFLYGDNDCLVLTFVFLSFFCSLDLKIFAKYLQVVLEYATGCLSDCLLREIRN